MADRVAVAQKGRRYLRIEDILRDASHTTPQDAEVLGPGMDQEANGTGQNLRERRKILASQWIDGRQHARRSDLHQAQTWVVVLLGEELGIQGDDRLIPQLPGEPPQVSIVIDVPCLDHDACPPPETRARRSSSARASA